MEVSISDDELSGFSDMVAETMGLDFPPSRRTELSRGIAATTSALGFENCNECVSWLMSGRGSKQQLETLASHLTVGETYFFRDTRSFEVLTEYIVSPLIHKRGHGARQLRVWSAGCCTGEEIYSIAIHLRRIIPDWNAWNISLLGTDINVEFLRRAEAGVFGSWSFRNAPDWLKDNYFRPAPDGKFEILPEIKRMVRFAPLNLAEDIYPSLMNGTTEMDVIFCRNVLMYFTAPKAQKVFQALYRAQTRGGWLIVGPNELMNASSSPYAIVHVEGMTLCRKESDAGLPKLPVPTVTPPATINELPAIAIEVELPDAIPRTPVTQDDVQAEPIDESVAQAQALYEQGAYADAIQLLNGLLSQKPAETSILRLLSRSLANQGRLAESLACFDQWMLADKTDPLAPYLCALVLQEHGKLEEAAGLLRRALYLDSNFALAHFAMGQVARARGRAKEAEKHFENTFELLRDHPVDEILPESDGMTAGRIIEFLSSVLNRETTTQGQANATPSQSQHR